MNRNRHNPINNRNNFLINPANADLAGGAAIRRVPVIPWQAYLACGLKVAVAGKVMVAVFTPQPMETPDEAFQTLRFIVAAQQPKPGPIAWETVPPEVQKHFSFPQETETPTNPANPTEPPSKIIQ